MLRGAGPTQPSTERALRRAHLGASGDAWRQTVWECYEIKDHITVIAWQVQEAWTSFEFPSGLPFRDVPTIRAQLGTAESSGAITARILRKRRSPLLHEPTIEIRIAAEYEDYVVGITRRRPTATDFSFGG